MKKNIHPKTHLITVVMTDGTEYQTRTTWKEEGAVMKLDIDPLSHSAWIGGKRKITDRGGQVSKFKKRFSGLSIE
ncbi:Large ribosomal subunit protein bL31 [Candidatus Liberibacter solanacearum]|uniref:50S ribosomal protein L31 n=2 Tax=Candidatus Liberibacter solanacearum TaxID=556287 RepID=A0A095BEL8_9HYPH|nr:50S ribosomal protein L31 [Candidatus Liberibacter solanacearum]ADR52767.1 50S ribosomal protein L31 [Candidatus Liberibacter solanacearum CLso-ZC1]KGB27228.1 50S ribosomal protein L31 [Candidatus Liberibacter solanacearum]KJZ80674.1 50S ribosomal protein L31 [Candidatus Liberibacter solanacearum]KJZ81389.1 LSU ribosomal protein L31p [Candidatus Liberibacter solanacearum]KQC48705.1 50S ribosomal protein L31 [Candidatus Liberibacter solanacearum]